MLIRILLVCLLLLTNQNLYSQKLIAQHYTMADGLPSNELFSIIKDKRGIIWIGTDRGICKFDGKNFKTFTINDGMLENTILEVKEDKLGRIWCRGFSGQFSIIDKEKIVKPIINEEIKKLNINAQFYQFEFDDSLNVYLAARNNSIIYKAQYPNYKLNQIRLPKSNISFYQISITQHITSYNMILDSKMPNFTATIALKEELFSTVLFINKLQQNYFLRYIYTAKYLVFSTNNIIHLTSLQTKRTINKTLPFQASSITLITDSTFFIGGFNGELVIFNINDYTFHILDKFPSSISNIYYENKSCWIATLRNGIYQLPNINYQVLHVNNEPLISMLPVANDSLYVLNAKAETELIRNKKSEKLQTANKEKALMYWQHFDHSQKEYIPLVGCYDYMIKRSNKEKIKFNFNVKPNWYLSEFVVPMDSLIYVSFYGGLRVFNQKNKEVMPILNIKERATCMFGKNGVLYIGTFNGIYTLVNNTSVLLDTNSFFKNRVTAIDNIGIDTLIIATQANGIGIYNIRTKKLSIIDNIGLDKMIIQYVFVDDEAKIWIATQKSIHVLKLNNNKVYDMLDVVDLNLGDLSIKEVRTYNKQVYILAGNKVVTIPENLIQFNSQTYPIILNEILVNGSNKTLKDLAENKLLPKDNNLLVKFQLLSFIQNYDIEYRYQLNNAAWVYTSNNELQLASLPSGKHSLIIQGRLKNGLWSSSEPINFSIGNPFYKSGWFIALFTIGTILAMYFLLSFYFTKKYKNRLKEFELKRQLESARLMASKSQMNPHFIFNALNSIQNFVIKSDKMQAYQYLTDFSILIRNYLDYSNKDYIKIDKEIDLINTYIKIEQLRIPFEFEWQLSENINANEEFIFTLLLQPCLENAIWHGLNHKKGDKKLIVIIKKVKNIFEVSITDNGIGRAQSAVINKNRITKPASVATTNMLSRIRSLKLLHKNNIELNIFDSFDDNNRPIGTTVIINFEVIYEKN